MTCTTAWFPLWIGDYIADTTHLSCEQHGAYFLLMLAYYRRGQALPDDDAYLAGITQSSRRSWRYLRPVIAEFFQIEDGLWHHKRVDAEMAEQINRAAIRSRAASANAHKRWKNGYSEDNPAKSKEEDMPSACEPHTGEKPPSNLQKQVAKQKMIGLVDSEVNEINGLSMLQSQGSSLPLTGQRELPTHARDATPPLPSRGDGDAALRAVTNHKSEGAPPTEPDDPAPEAEATVPPPDPLAGAFRARLVRLNALAGERLSGDRRWRAWQVIAEADTLGSPNAIPPPILAELAAIESLGSYAQAAE